MPNVKILDTEQLDGLVKISLEISSDYKFYVGGEIRDPVEATDEYKQELNLNLIRYDHYFNQIRTIIYLPNEYTDDDFNSSIQTFIDEVNADDYDKLRSTGPVVQETIYSNGSNSKSMYQIENAPQATLNYLSSVFPDVDLSTIGMISSAAYHEILQEDIITAYLIEWGVQALVQNDRKLLAKCRKFCMSQGKYYDREYIYCDESFDFLPESVKIIGKSDNVNAQDGLILPNFFDVYFQCDPDIAESFFNLEPIRGEYSTYYGVTVLDGVVQRVKQYVYDEQSTFSDWLETKERIDEAHSAS